MRIVKICTFVTSELNDQVFPTQEPPVEMMLVKQQFQRQWQHRLTIVQNFHKKIQHDNPVRISTQKIKTNIMTCAVIPWELSRVKKLYCSFKLRPTDAI